MAIYENSVDYTAFTPMTPDNGPIQWTEQQIARFTPEDLEKMAGMASVVEERQPVEVTMESAHIIHRAKQLAVSTADQAKDAEIEALRTLLDQAPFSPDLSPKLTTSEQAELTAYVEKVQEIFELRPAGMYQLVQVRKGIEHTGESVIANDNVFNCIKNRAPKKRSSTTTTTSGE